MERLLVELDKGLSRDAPPMHIFREYLIREALIVYDVDRGLHWVRWPDGGFHVAHWLPLGEKMKGVRCVTNAAP